jgi:hypothetical protein
MVRNGWESRLGVSGLWHLDGRIQQFFLTCIEFGKFPLTAFPAMLNY